MFCPPNPSLGSDEQDTRSLTSILGLVLGSFVKLNLSDLLLLFVFVFLLH